MSKCIIPLPNPGNYCKVEIGEIRRVLYTSIFKESGGVNKISLTNAKVLANWQTLFNKYNFSTSVLEKVVASPLVWGFVDEQGESVVDDKDGYLIKLADGTYTVNFEHIQLPSYSIKQLKQLEDLTLGVYLIDADNRVWGVKDGSDIKPIEIEGMSISNFAFQTRAKGSKNMVKFRIKNSSDMNELTSVTVESAVVTSDEDFFSLIDGTNTATVPATTGCKCVISTIYLDSNGNAVVISGLTYGAFKFINTLSAVSKSLAGAGSLAEAPNGTYTITETALLTSGQSYYVNIEASGYDVEVATITIP